MEIETMELFDALKILEFGQVLVQVNNVAEGYGYHQEGTIVFWNKDKRGILTGYTTGQEILIGKPLEGDVARYVIKNISDIN